MAERRREKVSVRETFYVPVEELARSNPQAAIYNQVIYQDMMRAFAPELYDPLNLAQVEIPGGVIIRAIVDGHTKFKFALDHGKEHGIDEIEAYDSTAALKRNPRIVPPGEYSPPDALTMVQYLRAVIEPTRVHQDIADKRIAAHLINGWEAIVGKELSRRFSATAALSMLADRQILIASESLLDVTLSKQELLLEGETVEERQTLQTSLRQLASILRGTDLRPADVYREAFLLVSSADPIIGGEAKALVELYGLLNLPAVVAKTRKSSDQVAVGAQAREALRNVAIESLSKVSQLGLEPTIVADIVLDPELSFEQTLETLQAENPAVTYEAKKIDLRREKLTNLYRKINSGSELTESENFLIGKFSQISSRTEELQKTAGIIYSSVSVAFAVEQSLRDFKTQREALLFSGVNEETLVKVEEVLSEALEYFYNAESPYQLRNRARELKAKQDAVSDMVAEKRTSYQAGVLFERHLLARLEASFGSEMIPTIKARACSYLINFEVFDNQETRRLFSSLSCLDDDLLLRVFDGRTTLQYALELQRQKNIPQTPRTVQIVPPQETTSLTRPVAETVYETPNLITEVEKSQNLELSELLRRWSGEITYIELNPESISEENKNLAWDVVNKLVVVLANHPNARRVIEEDYPELLRKVTEIEERRARE